MGINFSEVNFSYQKPKRRRAVVQTLHGINLRIDDKGEFIAIVGHTGSGKSTLVQMMNALLLPLSGRLEIFGTEIKKKTVLKPIRKRVGLVFQFPEYQIFEETVLKDIAFGPKNFGLPDPEGRAREVAEIMGITDLLERSPFTLSGGQLRKVAICGILASNPEILILDEPTVGLDPFTKSELLELLKKLNREYEKSIIIITHDMDVVSEYAQRVIVLKEGGIVYDGDKKTLFKKEHLLEEYDLDYPETMRILKALKERFQADIDINQHSIEATYQEILKAFGEEDEH
ncbi:MAG: ATP-binding cassette domain-containing protein [Bacilli bacterium]|jgi:energy-coupling factor transport system ATP-binding protein|nr:energy-coupling factor transporter ATPase [Acholeplasmataceae bacterium]